MSNGEKSLVLACCITLCFLHKSGSESNMKQVMNISCLYNTEIKSRIYYQNKFRKYNTDLFSVCSVCDQIRGNDHVFGKNKKLVFDIKSFIICICKVANCLMQKLIITVDFRSHC